MGSSTPGGVKATRRVRAQSINVRIETPPAPGAAARRQHPAAVALGCDIPRRVGGAAASQRSKEHPRRDGTGPPTSRTCRPELLRVHVDRAEAQVLPIYTSGCHVYTRDRCVYTPRGCVYTRALVGCGPLLDGWCAAGGA